jgi:hypothetical protein
MEIDETMSTEVAFGTEDKKEDTFKFAEPEEKSSESLAETKEEDTATSEPVDNDSEEQKVPYSRFKKVVEERNETNNRIQFLEESLRELQENREKSNSTEDIELPPEWVKLYGDGDVAKEAFAVQLKREEQIAEKTIKQVIDTLGRKQEEEISRLSENEETIDNNLGELQEKLGKKLTSKQEEDILNIVDEFSPVGDDGKYVSLFPFDKAYEIYSLRNASKGQATKQARQSVADLTGNSSEGEVDASSAPFKRGWDSWREAI